MRNVATDKVTRFRAVPASSSRAELGESPLWDGKLGLRWLDGRSRRLFTLGNDGVESSVTLSRAATCVELGSGRDLLAVTRSGFGWLDPETGQIEQFVTVLGNDRVSMNDGAIDARGRCWAGSAVRDQTWRGELYRLDGGGVASVVGGIGMSNGLDWSPSDDVMYHVDSTAGTVTAWEYDLVGGTLGASRVLRSVPPEAGLPDGLTVDVDGNVWLAIWGPGHVLRLDPENGDVTAVVEVPTPFTTSCTFGGPDLATLYVTTANCEESMGGGLVYAVDVPTRGRRPHHFAGELR